MDTAVHTFEPTPEPAPRPSANAPQLRTLLLTDLVDSTGVIERLGDTPASELFRAHDRLVLQLQQQWRGRLIDRSDGLLLLFERPIDGLGFALDYTRGLLTLGKDHNLELRARAGLHVGEVLTWRNSAEAVSVGAKPLEVEGLAKPMAARLMAMARPGQILLSAVAEPLAHRAARELGERGQHLVWKPWGRWRFKGVPDVQEIFEVGEPDLAPLRAPPSTPKAWRDIPLWRRPAALAAELALLAVGALGVWFITRPEPAIAFNQRDWVVVGDLRNLTGNTRFDDALGSAFRLGLEQSQYVNVVPDLQVRDALKRMQRKTDLVVDRALGTEIAQREGARALILPTVSEVGGRLRFSAEIVDPRTGTTVRTELKEGRGDESVLSSVDSVLVGLRGSLGESMQNIERSHQPLEKITTANLDALKLYALAEAELAGGNLAEAQLLVERALKMDPQFAMAWMRLGVIQLKVLQQPASAGASWRRAQESRDRLSTREVMYLEGVMAMLEGSASEAVNAWTVAARMYPEAVTASYNQGISRHWYAHDLENAIPPLQVMARSRHPQRGYALVAIGMVQLEQGRIADAHRSMEQAGAFLKGTPDYEMALPALAAGDGDRYLATLGPEPMAGPLRIGWKLRRAAAAVDQGDIEAAVAELDAASGLLDNPAASANQKAQVALARIGLTIARNEGDAIKRLRALVADELRRLRAADGPLDRDAYVHLAQAALLALRMGDPGLARQALEESPPDAKAVSIAVVAKTRATAECLLAHADSAPTRVTCLKALVDGREYFQTHVALWNSLREADDKAGAAREAAWLKANRGRAVAEGATQLFIVQNLLDLRDVARATAPGRASPKRPGA